MRILDTTWSMVVRDVLEGNPTCSRQNVGMRCIIDTEVNVLITEFNTMQIKAPREK